MTSKKYSKSGFTTGLDKVLKELHQEGVEAIGTERSEQKIIELRRSQKGDPKTNLVINEKGPLLLEQPVELSDRLPVMRPVEQPVMRPVEQPAPHSDELSNHPSSNLSKMPPVTLPVGLPVMLSDGLSDIRNSMLTREHTESSVSFVSERLLSVLYCFYYNTCKVEGKLIINTTTIEQVTGLTRGSIKDAIHNLKRYEYFKYTKPVFFHKYRGITYSLNTEKCEAVFSGSETSHLRLSIKQPVGLSVKLSDKQPDTPSLNSTVVSKFFESKNKLTNADISSVYNDPLYWREMSYWQEQGLREANFLSWVNELKILPADLIESCCNCWFKIVVAGKEKDLKKGPLDYLYGSLKKYGFFSRPTGYVSALDQAIARQRERNKKLEELDKLQEEERKIKEQAELNSSINVIMDDRNHQTYIEALKQLESTSKGFMKGSAAKGAAFQQSMRAAIRKILEADLGKTA